MSFIGGFFELIVPASLKPSGAPKLKPTTDRFFKGEMVTTPNGFAVSAEVAHRTLDFFKRAWRSPEQKQGLIDALRKAYKSEELDAQTASKIREIMPPDSKNLLFPDGKLDYVRRIVTNRNPENRR